MSIGKRLCACGLLVAALLVLATVARAAEPSENRGRRGTYLCKTSDPACNYYVCVPESYSDDNPAGLHLFFHGQGGQGGAASFGLWSKDFLEPFNLIGINMQYTDGDNTKDPEGKVAAAVEAIRQTLADYKVIRGRGVVCSFSGGGVPHAMLVSQYAKRGTKPGDWPFNHSASYGSNYRGDVKGLVPMSWFLGLGGKEWNLANAGLGRTQTARTGELFAEAALGRCPDIYLKITKDKGHSISEADRVDSAKGFHRSDLAFCGFLYESDYPERELAPVVKSANALDLGRAASAVATLLKNDKLDAVLRAKAERVRDRIAARVDAVVAVAAVLAPSDEVLAEWYGRQFARQMKGHPREGELNKVLATVKMNERTARGLLAPFANVSKFFTSDGRRVPEAAAGLKKTRSKVGPDSLLGKMADEFLTLE
ncbi:MAG TPA: hypothetical protein VMY39_08320 [Planctomycetota bacterium]|nr:hypothetical protein [Planctomycetota bacterium]